MKSSKSASSKLKSTKSGTSNASGPAKGPPSTKTSKDSPQSQPQTTKQNLPSNHSTPFGTAYDRSDLPVRIEHTFKGPRLQWNQDLVSIDYERYLPIFCEGLRETKFPHHFLAEEGVQQMIYHHPEKVPSVIPYMVQPLKTALRSGDPKLMIKVMKILQQIAREVPGGGQALVPYYRQLLPDLGRYKTKNINLGDGVEYGQWRNQNLADVIEETLQTLEMHGGPDSFINIRYVIPLYESCNDGR